MAYSDQRTSSSHSAPSTMSLRPQCFAEYIGQQRMLASLSVCVEAAKRRGDPLDHALFSGPPGLGKTSIAHVLAAELGVSIRATSGFALMHAGDLAAILTSLEDRDILFIDEIHRLPSAVEEALYPAMEDGNLDLVIGEGPSARTLKLDLPRFTLIGATTRAGALTAPFRDRFGLLYRLEFYAPEELQAIVTRTGGLLDVTIDESGAAEIARRARGTPRIANRLVKRVRDFAQIHGHPCITQTVAAAALAWLYIDEAGLDEMDRQLLATIATRFGGGPVGIDALAAAVNEEPTTLEDVHEPYLVQAGFIDRTKRGRQLTPKAWLALDNAGGLSQGSNPIPLPFGQRAAVGGSDNGPIPSTQHILYNSRTEEVIP